MPNDNTNKLSLLIDRLTEDLDALRRYVCWIESDPTGANIIGLTTTPEDVAQGRDWDCFPKKTTYCCDNCGNDVAENDAYHYAEIPWDVRSANKGESATLCAECEHTFILSDEKYREMAREDADHNNEHFRGNHK